MTEYKLTYFDGRGHVETIRYIFALAEQDYEDVRISVEEWFKMKKDTPFRQLPVLEVDGVQIGQHKAMTRFVAKRFNMAGKTDVEAAHIDMIVDCMDDTLHHVRDIFSLQENKDPKKDEVQKKFGDEQLPEYLSRFEKLLKTNNDGEGFFVGDSVTWADLYFAQTITWIEPMVKVKVIWDNFPKLEGLKNRVENLPKLAEWIKKRPKTQY